MQEGPVVAELVKMLESANVQARAVAVCVLTDLAEASHTARLAILEVCF